MACDHSRGGCRGRAGVLCAPAVRRRCGRHGCRQRTPESSQGRSRGEPPRCLAAVSITPARACWGSGRMLSAAQALECIFPLSSGRPTGARLGCPEDYGGLLSGGCATSRLRRVGSFRLLLGHGWPRSGGEFSPADCAQERPRVLLYTDATGGGEMAWVAMTPWGRVWAAAPAPQSLRRWVLRRKTQVPAVASFTVLLSQASRDKVATWELVAALVGLRAVMQGTESLEAGRALPGLRSGGRRWARACAGDLLHRQQRGVGHAVAGQQQDGCVCVCVPRRGRAECHLAGNRTGIGWCPAFGSTRHRAVTSSAHSGFRPS